MTGTAVRVRLSREVIRLGLWRVGPLNFHLVLVRVMSDVRRGRCLLVRAVAHHSSQCELSWKREQEDED